MARLALDLRAPQARHALALSIPALVFGFLLTAQIATQNQRSALTVRYNAPLIDAANALQAEQNQLKEQLAELRARLDGIQQAASSQSGVAAGLGSQIDELKLLAGLTPVAGEGIVVILDDAKLPTAGRLDLDKAICHSTDITDVINAGWKGGAEAIAVNDERIVGTSSVYCVGSTIMVNGTLMSPPFQIAMIGPQQGLMQIFEDPGELSDIKQRSEVYGLGFRVSRQREIRLEAFTGSLGSRHATPQSVAP